MPGQFAYQSGGRRRLASPFWWALLAALGACSTAHAGDRLLGTSGVTQVEGSAGGGLVPWALIAGMGSSDQVGTSVNATHVRTQGGYQLDTGGVAVGIHNRVELSMAQWSFRFSDTVPGQGVILNMASVKVRLVGDAVYDQDSWLPQISVGGQYKVNQNDQVVPKLLGASRGQDTDWYLAATKVWLNALWGCNLALDVTLRETRANQFGILGFGGDLNDRRQLEPEVSAGLFVRDDLVLGGEWRDKPNNLSAFREDAAWDGFVAWFATSHFSLTAAWLNLGNIANKPNQQGPYVSAQVAF